MHKFATVIFALLALAVSLVSAQIPDFPQYLNNTDIYPDTRCKDFCTFLGPRQICPGQWTNPACLCAVYDVRLPACEECWASKNSTIAQELTAVLEFCTQYASVTASYASQVAAATSEASAMLSSTTVIATATTTVNTPTGSAASGSSTSSVASSTATIEHTSGASGFSYGETVVGRALAALLFAALAVQLLL